MAGSLQLVKTATSTSNTDIFSVTDCFNANYDVYKVVFTFIDDSGIANNTFFRLLDSSNSAISSGSLYDYAVRGIGTSSNFDSRATGQNEIFLSFLPDKDLSLGKSRSQVAYVYNPFDSSSFTFTMHQTHGVSTGNEFIAHKGISVLKQSATHKGIQLIHAGSGNGIKSGATISVYGVK
tara:strand:+ start:38 stop:574 length:537 start_codon:yes stop_codon:yes gene_type:complete